MTAFGGEADMPIALRNVRLWLMGSSFSDTLIGNNELNTFGGSKAQSSMGEVASIMLLSYDVAFITVGVTRSVEEQAACFVVRDHNGQQLAYVYFAEDFRPALSSQPAHARRGAAIAANCRSLLRKPANQSTMG